MERKEKTVKFGEKIVKFEKISKKLLKHSRLYRVPAVAGSNSLRDKDFFFFDSKARSKFFIIFFKFNNFFTHFNHFSYFPLFLLMF